MLGYLRGSNSIRRFVLLSITVLLLTSCGSTGWRQIEIRSGPPAVTAAAVAYNSNSHKAILFGGINSILVDNSWKLSSRDETWEWNGENWKRLSPVNIPPGREKHVMAYDEARDRIVLFGGSADNLLFNDTWEWDGTDWQLMNPQHTPPARCCHAMAYDSARKRVVLYGGWDSQHNSFFNDVWLWNGKDWSQVVSRAPQMSGHFLVDFLSKGEIFSVQTSSAGTWMWDGKEFVDLEIESPPNRTDVRAVYDSENERIILFGGIHDKNFLNDTWIFDGDSWFQVHLPVTPSPRFGQVMFYDNKRNSVILFGGLQNDDPYYMNDMWELRLPKDLSEFRITLTSIPDAP